MKQPLQTTLRLTRTLGVIATVIAMLSSASGHQALEECPQQIVSQQVELYLVREEGDIQDSDQSPKDFYPASKRSRTAWQGYNRLLVPNSERDDMNGLGTYLLI